MKQIGMDIDDFKTFINNQCYYVDKTQLIEDIFSDKVVLYSRPRRFVMRLNMNMLYYFFSNNEKENRYLFDELKITRNNKAMEHTKLTR